MRILKIILNFLTPKRCLRCFGTGEDFEFEGYLIGTCKKCKGSGKFKN